MLHASSNNNESKTTRVTTLVVNAILNTFLLPLEFSLCEMFIIAKYVKVCYSITYMPSVGCCVYMCVAIFSKLPNGVEFEVYKRN